MAHTHPFRDEVREVARIAAPAVAHSILQTLVFLVDRLMLGHHSESALAAMQAAGPATWSVYSVFGAFTVGTTALVGRAIGARDARLATSSARASFALAIGIGLFVAVVGTLGVDVLLDALGRSGAPETRAAARAYLRVIFPAMPLLMIGMTSVAVLQATGDTRTPFAIGIATNAVSVFGNWVLIFGHLGAPRLGVLGAAYSNAFALFLEACLGIYALTRAGSPVSLRAVPGDTVREGARRVLALAWSSWGEKLVYHLGYLAYVGFIVRLGSKAMAANQALISIESISFLTADGCAVAAAALVSQRLGAGEPERAARAGWIAAGLAACVLGTASIVFVAIPELMVRAFRDDPQIVALGAATLRVGALAQIPMGIAIVLSQAIRGAGATREALYISFAGALVVRLAATFVFVRVLGMGLVGVWLGSTCDWWVRMAAYAVRWRNGAWQRARV